MYFGGGHDLFGAPRRYATFKNDFTVLHREKNRKPSLVPVKGTPTPAPNVYHTIGSAAIIFCFTSHKSKGTKAKCLD